jgi:hypothetical protein
MNIALTPSTSPIARAADVAALPRDGSDRFQFHVPARWRSPVFQNVHAAAAQAAVLSWFASLGCTKPELERVGKFDVGGYVGIPFPGLSQDKTILVGKYLSMWLLWDDMEVESLQNRWRITAADVRAGDKPAGLSRFDEGWWQLLRDFASRRSDAWIADLCAAMRTWDAAAREEALAFGDYRARGLPPTFERQLELRIATIGMYATVYLLEDAYDQELPRAFHELPAVAQIKRLANLIVGIGNDVLSFGKDWSEGKFNLVSTVMHERRLPVDEALCTVLRLHDDALLEYDRLASSLPSWSPEVDRLAARWLQDVRYASLGFSLWEARAPRYTAFKVISGGHVIEPRFIFGTDTANPFAPPGLSPYV